MLTTKMLALMNDENKENLSKKTLPTLAGRSALETRPIVKIRKNAVNYSARKSKKQGCASL